jgi:hypothetical protein
MHDERFFVSADFYHTKWQDYVYITRDNKQISPIIDQIGSATITLKASNPKYSVNSVS